MKRFLNMSLITINLKMLGMLAVIIIMLSIFISMEQFPCHAKPKKIIKVHVKDEDGKSHTVDPVHVRGFQNMDGKTYVLYINGTAGTDLLLDWKNMCLVIKAKYGSGATCHLGGRKIK